MEYSYKETGLQTIDGDHVEVVIVSFDDSDLEESDVSTISVQDQELADSRDGIYSEDEMVTCVKESENVNDIYREAFTKTEIVDSNCHEENNVIEAENIHFSNDTVEENDENTMDALDSNAMENFEERRFKFIEYEPVSDMKQENIVVYASDGGCGAIFETDQTGQVTLPEETMTECVIFSDIKTEGTEVQYRTSAKTKPSTGVQYGSPSKNEVHASDDDGLDTYIIEGMKTPKARGRKKKKEPSLGLARQREKRDQRDSDKREGQENEVSHLLNEADLPVIYRELRGARYIPPLREPATSDSLYQCGECGKSFTRKFSLNAHMSVHYGTSNYKCSLCGKFFIQLCHLKEHMQAHVGLKPNSCNHCDKRFTRVSDLKRHLLVHMGVKQFSCDMCSKLFSSKHGLQYHVKIHKGYRPWECPECDKKFVQCSVLKTHRKTHVRNRSQAALRTHSPRARSRPRVPSVSQYFVREEVVVGVTEESVEEYQAIDEIQEEIEI